MDLHQAIAYLRTNTAEAAQIVCAYYDRIPRTNQNLIDLDDLIAGARTDMHKIFSMIAESYSKISSLETSMVAAGSSPAIMRKRATYAQQRDGHKDAKMILQATGNAPVPVNQRITNNLIGNKIDNSQNTVYSVPTLEQVILEAEKPLLDAPPDDSR